MTFDEVKAENARLRASLVRLAKALRYIAVSTCTWRQAIGVAKAALRGDEL